MFRTTLILMSTLALAACGSGDTTDVSATPPAVKTSGAAIAAMTSMERGAILYKRCRSCHTLGQGEPNRVGPNLWSVFGQKAGAREDFNYSAAMAGSDIIWTDETVSAYIEKPSAYIPGNRMSYAGLRKVEDRLALIEYLRANTGADATGG